MAYSVAAGAVLTLTPQAQAAIVYSGLKNWTVDSGNTPVLVDLNGDANDDVRIYYTTSAGSWHSLKAFGTNGASLLYTNSSFKKLISGSIISSLKTVWTTSDYYLNATSTGAATIGYFINSTGFIGVKFTIGANTHYGWIRYSGTNGTSGTIIDWAYEDTPDAPMQPALAYLLHQYPP